MLIWPEILCASGVPGRCVVMGQLDSGSSWDETSMERIVDTDILSSPGVSCKNSDNWNGSVLVRSLNISAAL